MWLEYFRPQTCGAQAGYRENEARKGSRGGDDDASARCSQRRLEAVNLDSLAIKAEALFLIGQEVLHIFALVALELDHLSHLRVCDDGAIAGKLLLNDLEDLLLVEFLGQTLDRRQGFATIALCAGLTSAVRDIRAPRAAHVGARACSTRRERRDLR